MENRSNYHVQPNGEGLWIINELSNTAYRTTGEKRIEVPITKEILEEIKRQVEAEQYFQLFQKVNIQDDKIIGYLNFMLDDYYHYLSTDNQEKFRKKMQLIPESNVVDVQNAFYIQKIYHNLEEKDIHRFCDSLEEFQQYNQNYFQQILENTSLENQHLL